MRADADFFCEPLEDTVIDKDDVGFIIWVALFISLPFSFFPPLRRSNLLLQANILHIVLPYMINH